LSQKTEEQKIKKENREQNINKRKGNKVKKLKFKKIIKILPLFA